MTETDGHGQVAGVGQNAGPEGHTEVEDPQGSPKVIYRPAVTDQPRKTIRVVAAVVERDGRYLITQRRANAVLPHLWEFPGGRVEERESDDEALVREMRHRLGIDVEVGELISYVKHPYDKYTVELYLYSCRLLSTGLECLAVQDYRWVTSDEFDRYDFTPADEASMNKLLGEDS